MNSNPGNSNENQGTSGKTLWIGDLDTYADETYLAKLFENIAYVKGVKIIKDKNTNVSQGYGFIEFESNIKAKEVLENLNGKPIPNSNKTFKLNWASFSGGNSKNSQTSRNDPNNNQEYSIYVGDLDLNVTESVLKEYFGKVYSSVTGAKIVVDPSTKVSKGYGFVKFSDQNESQRAINEMSGKLIYNKPMKTNQAAWKNKGQNETNNSGSFSGTQYPNGGGMYNTNMNYGYMDLNQMYGMNYFSPNNYPYNTNNYYGNSGGSTGTNYNPNSKNSNPNDMYYNQYQYQNFMQNYQYFNMIAQQQKFYGYQNNQQQGGSIDQQGNDSPNNTNNVHFASQFNQITQPTFDDFNKYHYGGLYAQPYEHFFQGGSSEFMGNDNPSQSSPNQVDESNKNSK